MAVFTRIDKSFIEGYYGDIKNFSPINGGTDNSLYYFETKKGQKFILKLYEGKSKKFIKKILAIYKRLDKILTHRPILILQNIILNKIAIIFNYIENSGNYNENEIIEYIQFFHDFINKNKYFKIIDKSKCFDKINKEINYFYKKIKNTGYIKKYGIKKEKIFELNKKSLQFILNNYEELLYGYIHNDLNKGNIRITKKGPEFIDFDGVNKNLIIKDYIIYIIRFNLFDKLNLFFKKTIDGKYIIGKEKISLELIKNLYIFYSTYLILNMIYYIGYDKKDVKEEMYLGENQSWQEIYKNLQKNNILVD